MKREYYPRDYSINDDEYEGSPEIVRITDALLSDTSLWEKSATEPVVIERYHDYTKAFGKCFEDILLLYQNCLYDVRAF